MRLCVYMLNPISADKLFVMLALSHKTLWRLLVIVLVCDAPLQTVSLQLGNINLCHRRKSSTAGRGDGVPNNNLPVSERVENWL